MENNTNLPNSAENRVPTVEEIMSEVAEISAPDADVPSTESIQTPTVDDIPSIPNVETVTAEQGTVTEQSAQTAEVSTVQSEQPVQTAAVPTVQSEQPVQTAEVSTVQSGQPVQTAAVPTVQSEQPVQTAKVSTVQSGQPMQTAAVPTVQSEQPFQVPTQANVYSTQQLPAYSQTYVAQKNKMGVGRILAIIFGVLLSLLGAFLTLCVSVAYIDDYNTIGRANIEIGVYIITFIPLIIGVILIVIGCRRGRKNAVNNVVNCAGSTMQNPTVVQNACTVVDQQSGQPLASTMNYQYANTGMIQDESAKILKKKARNSGLLSIVVLVAFWLLVMVLDMMYFWLLILPFFLAFMSLKNSNGKSIAGWIGMLASVLSAVFLILFFALLIAS